MEFDTDPELITEYPFLPDFIREYRLQPLFRKLKISKILQDIRKVSEKFRRLSKESTKNVIRYILLILNRDTLQEAAKKVGKEITHMRLELSRKTYRVLEDLRCHLIKQGHIKDDSLKYSKELPRYPYWSSAEWLDLVYLRLDTEHGALTNHPKVELSDDLRAHAVIANNISKRISQSPPPDMSTNTEIREGAKQQMRIGDSLLDNSDDPESHLKALERFNFALKDDPTALGGFNKMANGHLKLGYFTDALAGARHALSNSPNEEVKKDALHLCSQIYYEYALVSYHSEHINNAVAFSAMARDLDRADAHLSWNPVDILLTFAHRNPYFLNLARIQLKYLEDSASLPNFNFHKYGNAIIKDINKHLVKGNLNADIKSKLEELIRCFQEGLRRHSQKSHTEDGS
jgi:tetratricopeptide (TPR) repeat protein